jgi:hypothetical protein
MVTGCGVPAGVDTATAEAHARRDRLYWQRHQERESSLVELPRFLSQVGSAESWSTELLTRRRATLRPLHRCRCEFCGSVASARAAQCATLKVTMAQQKLIFDKFLPEISSCNDFVDRVLIIDDSGSGKTLPTKQLPSAVAER